MDRPGQSRNVLVLLLVLFGGVPLPTAAASPAERTLDQILAHMDRDYFDPSYSGVDWQAETTRCRRALQRADTLRRQYALIGELLGQLKHSHLRFTPPRRSAERLPLLPASPTAGVHRGPKQIGFRLGPLGNQVVVTGVPEDAGPWRRGLRPGFVIQAVDDIPVTRLAGTEDPVLRLRHILFMFPRRDLDLTGIDHRGRPRTLKLTLLPYLGQAVTFSGSTFPVDVQARRIAGLGYLRFNLFLPAVVDLALQRLRSLHQAPALLLDLRGNPGGIAGLTMQLAAEFAASSYTLGIQTDRRTAVPYTVTPVATPFLGPVVVLVNQATASAAEILARGLQARQRAIVVGAATPGRVLPSTIVRFDDGSMLQYPIADFRDSRGVRLEGVGVLPDFPVPLRLADLRRGHDTQLTAAVALASRLIEDTGRPSTNRDLVE